MPSIAVVSLVVVVVVVALSLSITPFVSWLNRNKNDKK